MTDSRLGQEIRQRRQALDLTPTDLAHLADVDLTTVIDIERDRSATKAEIVSVVTALGCAPTDDGITPVLTEHTTKALAVAVNRLRGDRRTTALRWYRSAVRARARGDAATIGQAGKMTLASIHPDAAMVVRRELTTAGNLVAVDEHAHPAGEQGDEQDPSPTDTGHAYLVINDRTIGWAGTDRERADEYARVTAGLLVQVPIIADYRNR